MTTNSRKGLLIDLDGTLADSLGVMRKVYMRFLAEQGCAGSDAEFEELNGPPIPAIVALLKRRHGLEQAAEALVQWYDLLVVDGYQEVSEMPGAGDALEAAASNGWSVAVVTSSGSALARSWLARTGLAKHIAAVLGREAVWRGKPAPDLYLRALEETGCDAERSIAVEDSAQGAAAALKAGVRTYIVGAGREKQVEGALSLENLHVLAGLIGNGAI